MKLHANYQMPAVSNFRQEDFLSVPCMYLCKTSVPRGGGGGPFLIPRLYFEQSWHRPTR